MSASLRQFQIALYREHLEEASFLYEQRLAYLHDRELAWRDLDEFERRFEAHIDALVVGGDLAIAVCERAADEGDMGERHAAIRVLCRQRRRETVYPLLRDLDGDDAELLKAVVDALCAECPREWREELLHALTGPHKHVIAALATLFGYRRWPAEDALLSVLDDASPSTRARVLWALGRVGTVACAPHVASYLRADDEAVCAAASRALVRLGDEQAVRHALLVAQIHGWPIGTLAVGGGPAAATVLHDIARNGRHAAQALTALGMLGQTASAAILLEAMSDDELAPVAARALQLITGAPLYHEVFVAEEVDPDELFDEERERYERTGEAPGRGDGQPFGSTESTLSTDPAVWRSWLAEHKDHFNRGLRYRYGRPHSPRALLEALMADHADYETRELVADELVARYAAPFAFEADLPVALQLAQLGRLAAWIREHGSRFEAGGWYFAGRAQG